MRLVKEAPGAGREPASPLALREPNPARIFPDSIPGAAAGRGQGEQGGKEGLWVAAAGGRAVEPGKVSSPCVRVKASRVASQESLLETLWVPVQL